MSDTIQFVLDGEIIDVGSISPTRTVLQYLREDLARCGTKEGCAEGDCGACTVVVAELNERQDGLTYKAVNACIQLLPTLDGKQLITVESLSAADNEPEQQHPVQRSMVDNHASQCGFCTPGFIMSLYAQYQTGNRLDRTQIDEVLSGNLCRCTGYRPIVDAALRMYDYASAGTLDETSTIALLQSLPRWQTRHIEYGQQQYTAPLKLSELAELVEQNPDATLLAGGTDIGLEITKQHRQLTQIIYLGHVEELLVVEQSQDQLSIGAAVSLSDAIPAIVQQFPAFSELMTRFASLPIKNIATLGGNIANGSPVGDTMPALMVIGAKLKLRQGSHTREIALQDFYLDYQKTALKTGEFIEQILLPLDPGSDAMHIAAFKVSKRFDQDISAVCGAYCLQLNPSTKVIEAIRIAYGGLAVIPKRALGCEAALQGQVWNEASLDAAINELTNDFSPISDMRAGADYRQLIAANLLRRFFLESNGHAGQTNVYSYGR